MTRVGPAPVRYAIKLLDIDGGLNAATKIANGLNGVQQTFTFTRARGVAPELARRMVNGFPHLDIDRVPDTFYTRVSPLDDDRVVCLTDRFLTFTERKKTRSNYLAYNPPAHERVFFVSYHGLRDHAAEAGVSFEAAVAFMVIGELVDYFFEIGYHKQTRNCPMDFTEQHADLVGGLQAGRFCAPCEKKLKKNPTLERAVKAMLAWDR